MPPPAPSVPNPPVAVSQPARPTPTVTVPVPAIREPCPKACRDALQAFAVLASNLEPLRAEPTARCEQLVQAWNALDAAGRTYALRDDVADLRKQSWSAPAREAVECAVGLKASDARIAALGQLLGRPGQRIDQSYTVAKQVVEATTGMDFDRGRASFNPEWIPAIEQARRLTAESDARFSALREALDNWRAARGPEGDARLKAARDATKSDFDTSRCASTAGDAACSIAAEADRILSVLAAFPNGRLQLPASPQLFATLTITGNKLAFENDIREELGRALSGLGIVILRQDPSRAVLNLSVDVKVDLVPNSERPQNNQMMQDWSASIELRCSIPPLGRDCFRESSIRAAQNNRIATPSGQSPRRDDWIPWIVRDLANQLQKR